jgi:hypothetical protein
MLHEEKSGNPGLWRLNLQEGFIPILYWSAESRITSSHKSAIEDFHWLPKNVLVILNDRRFIHFYSNENVSFIFSTYVEINSLCFSFYKRRLTVLGSCQDISLFIFIFSPIFPLVSSAYISSS